MSDNQTIVVGLLCALGIGVLILCLVDRFYVERTGKPSSERVREKNKRMNRPLTRRLYLGESILFVVVFLVFLFGLVWTDDFKGWDRLFPFTWLLLSAFWFYQLQVRWRAQQRKDQAGPNSHQLSGTPR